MIRKIMLFNREALWKVCERTGERTNAFADTTSYNEYRALQRGEASRKALNKDYGVGGF